MKPILMVLLVLCASIASATIWRVPDNFLTIQAAIDSPSTSNGDTVELTAPTYSGAGNVDVYFRGKAITVRSQSGDPNLCVINCGGMNRGFVFYANEGPGSVLEGVTIRNGGAVNWGGAVYCGQSSPTIRNCIISGCAANYGGGGLLCYQNSSPAVTNCTFSSDTASYGGGLYCELNCSPTFTGCTFRDDSATWGGGIFCYDNSSPVFTNCDIVNNWAEYEGGGVYCEENSSPSFADCAVDSNRAGGWGGGGLICIDGCTPALSNCSLRGNEAIGDIACGGGVYCGQVNGPGSSPSFSNNCSISGNTASVHGGGVFSDIGSGPNFTDCHIDSNSASSGAGGGMSGGGTFTRCTLTGNWAFSSGGGLAGGGNLTDCTISGNSTQNGGGVLNSSSSSYTNCTISRNDASGWGGGLFISEFVSPTFMNCRIDSNSAWEGGGVFCGQPASPVFENCQFAGNTVNNEGAGVYLWTGSSPNDSDAVFMHCTFSGNGTDPPGGQVSGIYCRNSKPTFNSTIIAFTEGVGIYFWISPNSRVRYCDMSGNSGGNVAFFSGPGDGPPGIGVISTTNANSDSCDQYYNIFLDPLFVNPPTADMHLTDYSHCIGAADPAGWPSLDFEGDPRPNPPAPFSLPDIGVDENPNGVPTAPPVTDLVISIQSGNAVLNWSAVTGATTYNIYGALTPFVPGMPLVNVTGTSWTDYQTASRPSPYFYYVTAVLP